MKIVFSRKGFDSTSGGAPSPIIKGVPISLPIPRGKYPSVSTYGALGLGDRVFEANSKWAADTPCHEDPMFWEDKCAFGQTGAAQSHLANHGVGVGDVFLFFGLFAEGGRDRHHRIFGYLNVERVFKIGAHPTGEGLWRALEGAPRQHPHTIAKWDSGGKWDDNNTIYVGRGGKAKNAHKALRLTKEGGQTSNWVVRAWLRETKKLTCHEKRWRWLDDGRFARPAPDKSFGSLPRPASFF